jgi:chemotaxis protein MotB
MKKNPVPWAPALLILCLFTSCISQKKYQESLQREQSLLIRNNQLQSNITALRSRIDSLQQGNAQLVKQINDAMKQASDASGTANMTQKQLEAEQKRLIDLRRLLDQQQKVVESLRKKMSDALVGFNANELQVFVKNGRVYVSLQENLLFPSGSAVVNQKGKEALGTLAQVLNVNPDINIIVEGHTDSIPIRGRYPDNWALSVGRSTAIVRILTETYKINPTGVTASGRSRFEPVEGNETAEGRQRNRRTEIILAPKLDEVLELLQQNTQGDSAAAGTGDQ